MKKNDARIDENFQVDFLFAIIFQGSAVEIEKDFQ
jgi:hypothetical protein